jgi:hypothetical protein
VQIPPGTGSLQPVAIEATRGGNETVGAFETNVSFSDAASRQAVTQVNVEQASASRRTRGKGPPEFALPLGDDKGIKAESRTETQT